MRFLSASRRIGMTGLYYVTGVVVEARLGEPPPLPPKKQNELSFRTNPPSGGEVRNRVPLRRDELTEGNLQSRETEYWHKKK